MTEIVIDFAGDPVPKARARVRFRGGRVTSYTPTKTAKYEDALRAHARDVMGTRQPLAGPVSVHVTVSIRVPASWTKRQRQAALDGEIMHIVRPDFDNFGKSATDPLNGIVYHDDRQIFDGRVTKIYSEEPGVRIVVRGRDEA